MEPITPADLGASSAAETSLLIAFTRLEGKVDVALAQHGADLKAHADDLADHEARLRVLEATPTVSPKTLWTVVVSASGLIFSALTLLDRFYGAA